MYGSSFRVSGNEVVSAKGPASGNLIAFSGVERSGGSSFISMIVDFYRDSSVRFVREGLDFIGVELKFSVVSLKNFFGGIQFQLLENQYTVAQVIWISAWPFIVVSSVSTPRGVDSSDLGVEIGDGFDGSIHEFG